MFAHGLEPGAGPSLIFETLPVAFGDIAGGTLIGTLFFVLLMIAAWTSSISLVEPAVTMLIERFNVTRLRASAWVGLTAWILGFATAFSFNLWSEVTVLGMTFFDHVDFLTSNLMLPLGGVGVAIFAGWVMTMESTRTALDLHDGIWYSLWVFSIRFVAPVAVLIVLLHAVGTF